LSEFIWQRRGPLLLYLLTAGFLPISGRRQEDNDVAFFAAAMASRIECADLEEIEKEGASREGEIMTTSSGNCLVAPFHRVHRCISRIKRSSNCSRD